MTEGFVTKKNAMPNETVRQFQPTIRFKNLVCPPAGRDARVKREHPADRYSTCPMKLVILHNVNWRCAVCILSLEDNVLRNSTAGQFDQDDLIPPDLYSGFNLRHLFLCCRGRAEHETHAGDPDERPPND